MNRSFLDCFSQEKELADVVRVRVQEHPFLLMKGIALQTEANLIPPPATAQPPRVGREIKNNQRTWDFSVW